MKNTYSKKQKRTIMRFRNIAVRLFAAVMLVGFIMGLLFFLRPSVSDIEQRKLTEFPKFTIASFLNGSFFSEVSLWYSDTFPMRDTLIAADNKLKKSYGITTSTMMVGGQEKGDEIPTDVKPKKKTKEAAKNKEKTKAEIEKVDAEASAKEEENKPVEKPDSKQMEAEIQNQIQQGMYVKDGAAYMMYYFNLAAAETYTTAINQAAEQLDGVANVYSILVPNNSGVMLSEKELNDLGGTDQAEAIKYYYSLYDKVKPVKTIEELRKHNSEYLYFRTDHHWTQLGAYYVYRNFCKVKGWEPHELSEFDTMEFPSFLGTSYTALKNPDMESNPDTITAYIPNGTNDMTYWDVNGSEIKYHVVEDVTTWNKHALYSCFIAGDNPLTVIENPEITDGSSCLLVKESYGNAFAPFLVDHYQTVYVADFRYTDIGVVNFIKEKKIQDLIMMNNISIIGSDKVSSSISNLLFR